jgi:hypothetical protein
MPEDICAAILADGGSPEASLWKEIISDGPGNFDNVRYLLCGPLGIVQFVIAFNAMDNKAYGLDLGVHSPIPMYEGQKAITDDCPISKGVCFYDSSSLQAQELFEEYEAFGEDAIWETLRNRYTCWLRTNGDFSGSHLLVGQMMASLRSRINGL